MGMGPPVDEDDEIDFGGGGVPPVPDPPTFVAIAAAIGSVNAIQPALPAGVVTDDVMLAFFETSGAALTLPAEWTQVTNSPQIGPSSTTLQIFWKRYANGDVGPLTSDAGDHQVGIIAAFRGCVSTGIPYDISAGDISGATTVVAVPGAVTTQPNTLVVAACTENLDEAGEHFSDWANADLTDVAEIIDVSSASGHGGGIGVATGIKATAGAYGATAATISAAASQARISLALRPA